MSEYNRSLQLQSLVTEGGTLELSLAEVDVPAPGPDDVVVRVEAAPINPSDLALLIGPADLGEATASGSGSDATLSAPIPEAWRGMVAGRIGESMAVGNEAAGVVVAAGESDAAQALLGKTVAIVGGDMYTQYRVVNVFMAMPLPDGTASRDGASSFVNPLTALGMVETMRRENHTGLVHTAAASNLGQMLNRICLADDVPLVNIVRRQEQVDLLKSQGAKYVLDSSSESFNADLTDALAATGATLAFDATGGGRLGNTILAAMERAAMAGQEYNRYGSDTFKQLYIYGRLDLSPMELTAAYGFSWSIGGWLLTPFLQKIGIERMMELQQRVAAELHTTFASQYTAEISMSQALDITTAQAYNRRATGEKYLINPQL